MRGRSARLGIAARVVAAALVVAPATVGPLRTAAAPFPAQVAPGVGDAADCDVVVLGGTCSLGPTADGSPYTWTVPAGLTRVLAVVRGASGSTGDLFGAPGASGTVVAEFDLTPGSQLTMWVATAGDSRRGGDGWGRGGDGGEAGDALLHDGAGGGGASAIADGSSGDPVLVGAGGGGGGATYNPTQVGGVGGAGSDVGDGGADGVGPPREVGTGGSGGCGGCQGPGPGGSGQTSSGFSPGGGGGAGWAAGGGGGAADYFVSSGGGGGGGQNRIRGEAQQIYSGSGLVGQGVIQLMPAGSATELGCADGVQTYTPPSGTDRVVIVAVGGQGSRGHNEARVGHPAVVEGLVDLEPGESLQTFVGCSGDTESRAGFGSGGNSGDAPGFANDGGGAGGGTAVWGSAGGTILIAGGGGGTGGDFQGTGGYGGDGGLGWGRSGAQDGQGGQGTFGNDGDGGCGGCESQPNGGEGDDTDFPNFGGAGGGGGGGFHGGAGGEDSHDAAGGGGGAGSSFAGGRLQNAGIGTAGVNHSRGNGSVVFVAIAAPQASLRVTKSVTGPGSPAYSAGPFQLHSTCTHDGTTVLDVIDTLGPGAVATHEPLPIGAACTVTEPASGDGDATVPAAPQTVVLAAGINDVTMSNSFETTDVVVTVDVAGASQYSQRNVVVHLACTFDGRPLPLPAPVVGGALTFPPTGGSQTVAGLPQLAQCSFVQAAGGTATTVEYESADPPYARSTTPPRDLVLGPATATFTVIDTWLLDTMTVGKALAGNDPDPPVVQPFPMQVGCAFDGQPVTIAQPTFTVEPDATHVVADLPVGAVCDVSETQSFGATSTTYAPASTVVIHTGGTSTVTVTNTFDVGSLAITKVVAGAGAEFANAEFVVGVGCVDGATTTFEETLTFPPTGGNVTIPSILTGSICTITEPTTGGATATTFQTSGGTSVDSATVTIADGTTATVAITNRFDAAPLGVETRTLGDGVQFATVDYVVDVGCTFNELPVATRSFTFFPTGGSARIERLPVGARCAIDESETGGADPVDVTTANAAAPVVDGTTADVGIAPVAAGEPTSLRFDNTFDAATVTITKVVAGPAAYAADGFVIELACTFDGRPVRQLGPDGTRTEEIVPTGGSVDTVLPVGGACTIAELDDGGATTVDISSPTVTVAPTGSTVTVTNTFLGGELVVDKVVAGNDEQGHGPFPIDVACTFDGRPVVAPNGQPMSFSLAGGAAGTLTDLPVGAGCVVVEADDDGATSTTYTSSDPNVVTGPTSATVTIDDVATTVTVTNTFEVGPVTVAAALTGPGAATYGAGRSFTVRVGCTRTIDGRTFPIGLPGGGWLTLDPADGLSASIPDVPAGVDCAVVDDETNLATTVTIPPPGIVGAGSGVRFVVALDWELGTVVVTKSVVGPAPRGVGPFPFAAHCTAPTRSGPVPIALVDGPAAFALGAGGSETLAALAGASCTIVETDGAGATTSYALVGAAPAVTAGIAVVLARGATATVAVTNAFAAPTTTTGSGGGNLPSTGSSSGAILLVAAGAVVAGLAVAQLGRRRRDRCGG